MCYIYITHAPAGTHNFPIYPRLHPQMPKFTIQSVRNPPLHHGFHGFMQQLPSDSQYPANLNTTQGPPVQNTLRTSTLDNKNFYLI